MSELKIKGTLLHVTKYKEITDSFGIEKLYLDVTDNPEHPNQIEFQIFNKKIKTDFPIGTNLEVHFNIQGKKWEKNGKKGFIQNLNAWKILEENQPQQQASAGNPDNEPDDLPF